LPNEDADRFLQGIPVAEADIRRVMIEAAQGEAEPGATPEQRSRYGAHPFYLDLSVDTYLDIVATGRAPAPADFGKTHHAVFERFLRYRDLSEQATLKLLSAPRGFDRELFAALVERFQTGYPVTAYTALTGFSFVEPGEAGRVHLHALMRDHLYAELDAAEATILRNQPGLPLRASRQMRSSPMPKEVLQGRRSSAPVRARKESTRPELYSPHREEESASGR
jgi:hypothetical protein